MPRLQESTPFWEREWNKDGSIKITEDMMNVLNSSCPMSIEYQLDEKAGIQKIAIHKRNHKGNWPITDVITPDQVIDRMKLECSYHMNVGDTMMKCLKRNGLVGQDCKVRPAEDSDVYTPPMRQWKPWECRVMGTLDFRFWSCDCHYQAPFGKVIMGGCEKHD